MIDGVSGAVLAGGRVFSAAEVREVDREGRSFLDLDTQRDYAAALAS